MGVHTVEGTHCMGVHTVEGTHCMGVHTVEGTHCMGVHTVEGTHCMGSHCTRCTLYGVHIVGMGARRNFSGGGGGVPKKSVKGGPHIFFRQAL